MKENREILYSRIKEDDEIEIELKKAINKIEEKCKEIIGKNN